MSNEIETRLARLEAIEQIRALKTRYCGLCDVAYLGAGYDPGAIAALFTEDGLWDGGPEMRFVGRDQIARFFAGVPDTMRFARHHVTNPEIELAPDGLTAVGRWYLVQPATLAQGDRAVWLFGRYEDDYVRRGDHWLFRSVKVAFDILAPHDVGWGGLWPRV